MKKLLVLMLAVLMTTIPVIADEFPNDVPPVDTPPQVYMLNSAYDICYNDGEAIRVVEDLCYKSESTNWQCGENSDDAYSDAAGTVTYLDFGPTLELQVSLSGLKPNTQYQLTLQGRDGNDGNTELGNNCDNPSGPASGYTCTWECGFGTGGTGTEGFWNFDLNAMTDSNGDFVGMYSLSMPEGHYGIGPAHSFGFGFIVKEVTVPDSCVWTDYVPVLMETTGMDWTIGELIMGGGAQPNGFDLQMDGCLELENEWRFEEYAFTGEQLYYEVLVRDCNLAEDISYAKIIVDGYVEALCNQIPASEGDWSDQVPEKCGGYASAGFDPLYDKVFRCVLTVEPSWYGPKSVNIEAYDQSGAVSSMGIAQSWFFNPAVIIDVDTNDGADSIWYELPVGQNVLFPGQTAFSGNKLVVTNLAEGGVDLWAFIAATDLTDPTHSGAKCPFSNVLDIEGLEFEGVPYGMEYRCKIGTFEDDEWDWMTNKVNTDGCSPTSCANALPLLYNQGGPSADLPVSIIGNLKSSECQFRLTLPGHCTGHFTEGKLQVIVKAV